MFGARGVVINAKSPTGFKTDKPERVVEFTRADDNADTQATEISAHLEGVHSCMTNEYPFMHSEPFVYSVSNPLFMFQLFR